MRLLKLGCACVHVPFCSSRFPLGSEDDAVRAQGLEIMRKAIQFAQDVGIRVIQLAGYDVYYQEANNETRRRFRERPERER